MQQFDIVENANPESKQSVPYLLVLQAPLFDELATRVVAPLIPRKEFGKQMAHLTPAISVRGRQYVVSTAELAGVPVTTLGPVVDSVVEDRLEIISALDFLFTGS